MNPELLIASPMVYPLRHRATYCHAYNRIKNEGGCRWSVVRPIPCVGCSKAGLSSGPRYLQSFPGRRDPGQTDFSSSSNSLATCKSKFNIAKITLRSDRIYILIQE